MKRYEHKIALISAVACVWVFFAATAIAGTVTLQAGTYRELYDHLESVNPGGSQYTEDDIVIIELTEDLDAEAVGAETDYATGATLTIARSNITIDGKGKTLESEGLPSFLI
jgi:hypothetical protein